MSSGPAFFKTMQIPILAGRDIEETRPARLAGRCGDQREVRQSEFRRSESAGAALDFAGKGAGGRIARDMEIVGVSKERALWRAEAAASRRWCIFPYDQGYPPPDAWFTHCARSGDPLTYVNAVREMVRQADARVPVAEVRSQAAEIDRTINQEITFARLCTGFAMLALTIACVGLYGTVSYNVARRTGEIGIRMALGAQRGTVVWMVLREVCVLAAVGARDQRAGGASGVEIGRIVPIRHEATTIRGH